jgi:hypothetical protein
MDITDMETKIKTLKPTQIKAMSIVFAKELIRLRDIIDDIKTDFDEARDRIDFLETVTDYEY